MAGVHIISAMMKLCLHRVIMSILLAFELTLSTCLIFANFSYSLNQWLASLKLAVSKLANGYKNNNK